MLKLFPCKCGISLKTKKELRRHIKECSQAKATSSFICSFCSDSTRILLPYKDFRICPSCAVLHEKPIIVFGSPLINHMSRKYEMIFRKKAGNLLKSLNIKKLTDMGVVVVLITFSNEGFVPFAHSHSPKGELAFVFSKREHIQEREDKAFEYVIAHEVFHAFVYEKRIGVSNILEGPFTFLESFTGSLAEDIQMEKIAVNKNVRPLIYDEIRRTNIYYRKLPVLSTSQWDSLTDGTKFNCMNSVTLTYATELWFNEILRASHAKKQVKKNIRLVRPHYVAWGCPSLAKLIQKLYTIKIAQTKREKQMMYNKLLTCCDNWVESKGLDIF